MITFAFFDLVAAIREARPLKFTQSGSEIQSIANGFQVASRDARIWNVTTREGTIFVWNENNTGAVVISRV